MLNNPDHIHWTLIIISIAISIFIADYLTGSTT